MTFDAYIPAGGLATRLKYRSRNVPKALIKVRGVPNLIHTVGRLFSADVGRVFISVHEDFEADFRDAISSDKTIPSSRIELLVESERYGTAGTLIQQIEMFSENILVVMGDIYTEIDFRDYFDRFKASSALFMPSVGRTDHAFDSDLVRMQLSGEITEIYRSQSEVDGIALTGHYFFKKSVLRQFYKRGAVILDLTQDVINNLVTQSILAVGYFSSRTAIDYGTPNRRRSLSLFQRIKKRRLNFFTGSTKVKQLSSRITLARSIPKFCENILVSYITISDLESIGVNFMSADKLRQHIFFFEELPQNVRSRVDYIVLVLDGPSHLDSLAPIRCFPVHFCESSGLESLLSKFSQQ